MKNFISDQLFLHAAFYLSFPPSGFVSGLISRPKRMVVPPIFTADILIGPGEKTLGISRSLQ